MYHHKMLLALALFAAVYVPATQACNGYKIKIVKLENCAGADAVFTVDDKFTIKLNKQCELVPSGCVKNKAFTTAKGKVKVSKDGIVMKEEIIDACQLASSAPGEAKDMLKMFGAPDHCPVKEGEVCANDHKVDISKYKAMLGMARGNIVIDTDITHDTGKSCFHTEIEITKS